MDNADIGRFISADTIIPEPGNPQALNRYSYVLNNPIRYNDPTGHMLMDGGGGPDPLAGAVGVVGSPDPVIGIGGNPEDPCYWATGNCSEQSDSWLLDTYQAADYFLSIGWSVDDIDDIPWSPDQRYRLWSYFNNKGIRSWVDDRETEAMAGGFLLAVAGVAENRAAGLAFGTRAAGHLRPWGVNEEQFQVESPTGTAQFRRVDGTVRDLTGNVVAVAEFKLRASGRTINLTPQLRDMLRGEYQMILGFSGQARLSTPLQRALANAAWIRIQ